MTKSVDPIVDAFASVEFESDKKTKTIKDTGSKSYEVDKKYITKTFDNSVREKAAATAELVITKQHDYGPDNILKCPVGAELGIAVRLFDKLARLSNLIQSGATPANETLIDTAKDIQGYGLVLEMVLDGSFTLPLED